jgi:hypothetical protein
MASQWALVLTCVKFKWMLLMNSFSYIGGIQLFLRSDVWNSDHSWLFVSIALLQSLVIGSNKVGWGDMSDQSASPTLLLLCSSHSAHAQLTLSCIYVYFIFFYFYFTRYCNQLCIKQWKWILVLYRFQLIINITTLTEVQPTHQSYTIARSSSCVSLVLWDGKATFTELTVQCILPLCTSTIIQLHRTS